MHTIHQSRGEGVVKHVLLALLLLFGMTGVVSADDFQDGDDEDSALLAKGGISDGIKWPTACHSY